MIWCAVFSHKASALLPSVRVYCSAAVAAVAAVAAAMGVAVVLAVVLALAVAIGILVVRVCVGMKASCDRW